VGVRSTLFEDLYLILADVPDLQGVVDNDPGSQRIITEIQVNPLVGWIWYGGMILAIGSLISLWPAAEVRKRVVVSEVGDPVGEDLAPATKA